MSLKEQNMTREEQLEKLLDLQREHEIDIRKKNAEEFISKKRVYEILDFLKYGFANSYDDFTLDEVRKCVEKSEGIRRDKI